jgi:hypothetical protein
VDGGDLKILGVHDHLRAAVVSAAWTEGKSVDEIAIAALKGGMTHLRRVWVCPSCRGTASWHDRRADRWYRRRGRPAIRRTLKTVALGSNVWVPAREFGGVPKRVVQVALDREVSLRSSSPSLISVRGD